MGSPRIVFPPSFQLAGYNSPCSPFISTAACYLHPAHGRENTHGELEHLGKAQCHIDRLSDRQIIHRDLSQHALRIDQIARAERDPLVLDQTPVLARDAHVAVGQQRDAQIGPEAARGAGLLRPGVVRVLRVGRDGCVLLRIVSVATWWWWHAKERKKERKKWEVGEEDVP